MVNYWGMAPSGASILVTNDGKALVNPGQSHCAGSINVMAHVVAETLGMSYDDVDDVRIAAEEAFVYACDTLPEDGEVHFEFTVDDDEIKIDVPLGDEPPASDEDAERRAAYATFILESVSDSYGFESDETGAHLRLSKRVGGGDVD